MLSNDTITMKMKKILLYIPMLAFILLVSISCKKDKGNDKTSVEVGLENTNWAIMLEDDNPAADPPGGFNMNGTKHPALDNLQQHREKVGFDKMWTGILVMSIADSIR